MSALDALYAAYDDNPNVATAIELIEELSKDQFMSPYWEETDYWEVDTDQGTMIIPLDVELNRSQLYNYCEGKIISVNKEHGWIARLSAPGYMDCTEWSVFDTELDALGHLIELMGE